MWKGVQGGNPEGEERMRGSALSSPMGVPLGYFHGYKKNEEDEKREMFERRSHVSPHNHEQSIAHCFSPFNPLSVTHPPLATCSYDIAYILSCFLKWDSKGILSLWRGLGQRPIISSLISETDRADRFETQSEVRSVKGAVRASPTETRVISAHRSGGRSTSAIQYG